MRIVLVLLLPLFVFSQSYGLKTFINNASKTNGLIKAKEINIKSKQEKIEAAKSAYWPTVDIGADYNILSPNYVVSPGQSGKAYASVSMDLYDGGRKDAIVQSRVFEHEASLFERSAFEKSITLEISRHYYGIKSLKATLSALQERGTELKEQIKHVKKFLAAGLSTQEDVDKLEKDRNTKVDDILNEILPEAFAVMKETARRFKENEEIIVTATDADHKLAASKNNVIIQEDKAHFKNQWDAGGNIITWDMVHYDVQLIGGVVLHQGKIAEMATGEGKTLVAFNLAMAYASLKKRVLLVGADLRNPQLHMYLDILKKAKGLSEYLSNPSMNWQNVINEGFSNELNTNSQKNP